MNFNMNEIDKPLPELLSMLRTAEKSVNKGKAVMMVSETKNNGKDKKQHKKPKGKGKKKGPNKLGNSSLKPKGGVAKECTCIHCGVTGHWKRNCAKYLEELKKQKGNEISTSGIFVIEVNFSTTSSWVLDTGCRSYICSNVQDLKRVEHWLKVKSTYELQ